jgi:hypothetical protein
VHGQRFGQAMRLVSPAPDRDPRSRLFDQLDLSLSYHLYNVLES